MEQDIRINGLKPLINDFRQYIIFVAFFLIFLFFAFTLFDRGFLSPGNFMNILRQTAMVSIMAVGMTFAMCAGEIDLSIGSIVALSALITAVVLESLNSIPLAIIAGLGSGIMIGLINGLITTKAGIPAFLVTLGTAGLISGMARLITNLESVPIVNQRFNFIFGSGDIGPFSTLFLWTAVVLVLGHTLLRHTPFGRAVLATGGNRLAAKYTGIKTDRIKITVLVISSLAASFAGILYAGRLHGARYTLGESDLMTVIAAVIIGGTNFLGGKGSVVGAILGSIIMGMINNGLLLVGLSVSDQMIARGIIIIIAVSLTWSEKKEN